MPKIQVINASKKHPSQNDQKRAANCHDKIKDPRQQIDLEEEKG
jgi:hypothetical protein